MNTGYLRHILGNHENERIAMCIKGIVLDSQSGNELLFFEEDDMDSISDDEEFKGMNNTHEVGVKLSSSNYLIEIFQNSTCA